LLPSFQTTFGVYHCLKRPDSEHQRHNAGQDRGEVPDMASIDLPARTHAVSPPTAKVRTWLGEVGRRAAKMVSAARLRTSPALTISGLASIDASAWTSFGRGAGLLALGISALLYDWAREKP
jgi:hypothetical protein